MKKKITTLLALCACLSISAGSQQGTLPPPSQVTSPANGQLTPHERLAQMEAKARELIGKMTVQEKISQLMNEAAGIPRLGIKPYNWWNEALHGVGRDGRATVFPQPICTASSFDPQLIHDIGEAISTEGRAKYLVAQRLENYSIYAGLTFWSPNINIFRDPRWGRGMETYGEDPFLTGTMGTAFVRGMQGDDPVYERVASCAKHLAVHSGPESTRHSADIHPLRRDLFETYLPAFRMLVQEGKVEAVMSAYNSVYGESCSGSRFLLTDVLRNQWKFGGHIVSDCGAVADIYQGHAIAKTPAEAAAIALKAGLNLECGTTFTALQEAYDKGMVTDADLDHALQPLLMTRLRLGILEPDADCPYNDIPESVICSPQHRSLARRAALEGMVLLKNDSLLPFSKDIRTLYLLGPAATDTYYLMGNYYGLSDHYSSYLQGIIGKVSNGTSVNYKPAFNASYPNRNDMDWSTGEAMAADVVVAFLGINSNLEGEEGEAIESGTRGDRVALSLPESQMAYFRKLAKARAYRPNCKLVTVVCGGSPVDLSEIAAGSVAVVMAWYTGQEGGDALADLLFGDASFSGRLPITFPKSVDKLPPFDDYSMQGRTYKYMTDNIDYPFGYGLTYGKISYSAATATYAKSGLRVTAQVSNAAAKPVDETVQVYLSTPGAGLTSPLSSLVAFRRVRLEGGETQTVSFDIAPERLLTVQTDGTSRLLRGEYTVTVGGAAPSKRTAELGVSTVQAHFAVRR